MFRNKVKKKQREYEKMRKIAEKERKIKDKMKSLETRVKYVEAKRKLKREKERYKRLKRETSPFAGVGRELSKIFNEGKKTARGIKKITTTHNSFTEPTFFDLNPREDLDLFGNSKQKKKKKNEFTLEW